MNEELKTGAVNPQGQIIGAGGQVVGTANPLDVPTSINTSNLAGATPFNLPNAPVSTGADGLSAFASSYAKSAKAQQDALAQKASEAEASKEESKKGLMDTLGEYLGIVSSRPQLEQEAGLDVKAQKVTDYTNQIEALDRAEENEVRAAQGRGDITKEAQQGIISDIRRKYAPQKADIALLQAAANRDYETAFNILDRKIQLKLEPLKLKMEFDKFFYDENKSLFDKAEQREFENLIRQDERNYNEVKATQEGVASIISNALQGGVDIPLRVLKELDGARSVLEANQILARNGISLMSERDRLATEKARLELAQLNAKSNLSGIEDISPYQQERQTRILESVQDLKDRVNARTVGLGSLGKFAPASVQRNFANDLSALRANIAFGELTAMREASKTGGALGQVSNIELGLLESALAGLDQGQSPANFRKNLQRVEESIKRWQEAVGKYGSPSGIESDIQEVNGVRYQRAEDGLYYPI